MKWLVNIENSAPKYNGAPKLASERSKRLDYRRVLFISIFRKSWVFWSKIWKFSKSKNSKINSSRCLGIFHTCHSDSSSDLADYTNPFWTCHSSGNLVDGLPLAIHNKDAVLTSCRFSRRAPIRKFRCKILDDAAACKWNGLWILKTRPQNTMVLRN